MKHNMKFNNKMSKFKWGMMLLATAFTQGAFSEGLMLDTRFESVTTEYNDAAINASRPTSALTSRNASSFQASRMRMLYSTKFNDQLSGKVRFNLLQNNGAPNGESKLAKFVDYGFLTHQMHENFYLSAGKLVALIGGREALTNPGDYYFTSVAGAEILGSDTIALWPVGVALGGTFGDHKVEVLVANTTKEDKTTNNSVDYNDQTAYMVGVSYLGSLADKMVQPNASYHIDNESTNSENSRFMAVGSKFVFAPVEIDLDFLRNTSEMVIYPASAFSKNTTSIVGTLRYKIGDKFHVVAKVDKSTQEKQTAGGSDPAFTDTDVMQWGLAAEYYPYSDVKFRYHLAYVNKDTKPDGAATQTETKIMAGIRYNLDILK